MPDDAGGCCTSISVVAGTPSLGRTHHCLPLFQESLSRSFLFRIISVSSFFLRYWMDQTAIGKDAFEACKDILGADSQSVLGLG